MYYTHIFIQILLQTSQKILLKYFQISNRFYLVVKDHVFLSCMLEAQFKDSLCVLLSTFDMIGMFPGTLEHVLNMRYTRICPRHV